MGSLVIDAANSASALWLLVAVLLTIILALVLRLFERNDYVARLERSIHDLSAENLTRNRHVRVRR